MNIKCRTSGLTPDAAVLVCTVRAVKLHSGRFNVKAGKPLPQDLLSENLAAVHEGAANLEAHIEILRKFGIPVVVAINQFPDDYESELDLIREISLEQGVSGVAVTTAFRDGSSGVTELAGEVVKATSTPAHFRNLYPDTLSPEEKLHVLATKIYGAEGIELGPVAREQVDRYQRLGFGNLPICVAKTQYSLSHDPKRLGRPTGFRLPIREVRLAAGAGFLYALAGDIQTMPGLPTHPAASRIQVDSQGTIQPLP